MMTTGSHRILAVGECMVELTRSGHRELRLSYAGDACNTAVYLSRLGESVDFLTATGDDALSDELIEFFVSERLHPIAARIVGASPALYIVSTGASGERSFTYYRDASPVRRLLDSDEEPNDFTDVDLVYFTAITLQMLTARARVRLLDRAKRARARGARIAFDSNYRPAGWPNPGAARSAIDDAIAIADITLPSLDDELLLYGGTSALDVIERHRLAGVAEVVVKAGEGPVTTWTDGRTTEHIGKRVETPLDTTGAGDSFNAGYLHARLSGASVPDAVGAGRSLASIVVRNRGAIVDSSAFFNELEGQSA